MSSSDRGDKGKHARRRKKVVQRRDAGQFQTSKRYCRATVEVLAGYEDDEGKGNDAELRLGELVVKRIRRHAL